MIGLDSNVIIRYFAQDHAQQSLLASQLIDALTPDNPAFISTVALVETVWVLQRAYKVPQTELVGILQMILQSREFVVQDAAIAIQALLLFLQSKLSFADCLIAQSGHQHGCSGTLTFDAEAAEAGIMKQLA